MPLDPESRRVLEATAASLEREAQAIRAMLAAEAGGVPSLAHGASGRALDEYVEAGAAAVRFGYPTDTIRAWVRKCPDLGERRGGRVFVHVGRLKAYLAAR